MTKNKLIDNNRVSLRNTIRHYASRFEQLSIATGYWDLPGTLEVLDTLTEYHSIRLLIGQEPLPSRVQKVLKIDPDAPESMFPDDDIAFDLAELGRTIPEDISEAARIRNAARTLADMIQAGQMEVRVIRNPRLHAKAYIFGDYKSDEAVAIVGSSNFTKAGLTCNSELNALEDDTRIVTYRPSTEAQGHGHLSWFDSLWNDPSAVPWSGEFTAILEQSPIGDVSFGPYDVYIKTLMELYPDELVPPKELSEDTQDVLYSFQNRNAGILLNKLNRMGVAMLADSVGLGKTVTAGAIIKHYLEGGSRRIVIIAPASLLPQWREDLGTLFGLQENLDYTLCSMQDLRKIADLTTEASKPWIRPVNLFVVDEAHNLRASGGQRYTSIEELFAANSDSHVLLLTATPINNSLMDFANQLQLGAKGALKSIAVPYRGSDGQLKRIDFFEALKQIQSERKKFEKDGRSAEFDWSKYDHTLSAGLRHYLVRSTRQGIQAEGGIRLSDGQERLFPETHVQQIQYEYSETLTARTHALVCQARNDLLDGFDATTLDVEVAAEVTQQTLHPIDFFKLLLRNERSISDQLGDGVARGPICRATSTESVIPNLYQLISCLGFTPYRPEMYRHRYYGRTLPEVRELLRGRDEASVVLSQLSIHNILHVSWLKRLESSTAALLKSVETYSRRIEQFSRYLELGFIVTISEAETLESEYDDDLSRAFDDFEKRSSEIQEAIDRGEDPSGIPAFGVKRIDAEDSIFNIGALKKDLERDQGICALLRQALLTLSAPGENAKIRALIDFLESQRSDGSYGQKVLVFSFFADTIEYLEKNLKTVAPTHLELSTRSGFVSGKTGGSEQLARRFSPASKRYQLSPDEHEIDYLFATDVLSEGQNLQDAGILVNFDLHWNPVRMIQRNGRINRLGSSHEAVLIANTRPHSDLELYLRLVRRLETKIDVIRNSIGTDQSILGEDMNPKEFIDFFGSDSNAAAAALEAATERAEGDLLETADEHIYELRRFLGSHEDDGEIERIQRIPLGKWNWLPHRGQAPSPSTGGNVLALMRAIGKTSATETPIAETMFVSVSPQGSYRAEPIDDLIALEMIRTTPADNAESRIHASIDRSKTWRRARALTTAVASNPIAQYNLKSQAKLALALIQPYFPSEAALLHTVEHGLRTVRHRNRFEELVRTAVKENKSGPISIRTITAFRDLLEELASSIQENRVIDEAASLLYYIPRSIGD